MRKKSITATMKPHAGISLLLALSFLLCACQKTSSESGADSKTEPASTAAVSSTAPVTSAPTDPQSEFTLVQPELSAVFPGLQQSLVQDFRYDEYIPLKDQEYDKLYPFFLKENQLYLQKQICNFSNSSDIVFLQYNLDTGKTKELTGKLEDLQYEPHEGKCTFADGRIYASFGSETQQTVHFSMDTEKNCVNVLKTEPLDEFTSVCATFPVNNEEYVETYMTNNGNFGEELRFTYYVTLYNETGERNIVTREYGWNENYRYTVNDNQLYEYSQSETGVDPCLRVYDLNGNQLESYKLPEIEPLLQDRGSLLDDDMENSVAEIAAFGDYCLVTIDVCSSMHNKCVLYNLKEKTVCVLENCYYCPTGTSVDSRAENHILEFYSEKTESFRVYSLDNKGQLTPILERPMWDSYIVTDGDSLVYLDAAKKQLYNIWL